MTGVNLGQHVPPLSVTEWLQGEAVNFENLLGRVVLLEVFQVNCPGCFLYSLPQVIELYNRYAPQGLVVLGVATAFEDFDKNTLDNLKMLLQTGGVVGQTLKALTERGLLENGHWPHRMPFPVAMDRLVENQQPIGEAIVEQYIQDHFPHFYQQSAAEQQQLKQRIFCYLQQQKYTPQTFNRFALQGTPSHILVDKQGRLRHSEFGFFPELEMCIQQLLAENA
jgi:thiol-disulfide isomerase/thioredoxin